MAEVVAPKLDIKKLPPWIWVAGAGGAIILVYIVIRNNASSAATPAPGGSSNALAALSGFTQQLDQIRTGLQAEINALSKDQQASIKTLTDSINTSIVNITDKITALTANVTSLTSGQAALQKALSDALAQIAALNNTVLAGNKDVYAKFAAYNQIIQDLRDQLAALKTSGYNPFTSSAAIQAAYDNARKQLAVADLGANWQNSFWWNRASLSDIIGHLRADPTVIPGDNPIRNLLLSLIRDVNGNWLLPPAPVTTIITPPLPIIPPAPIIPPIP